MARTREQWNSLYVTPAANAGISSSNAAEWLEQRDETVTVAMSFESVLETTKADVDSTMQNKQFGSIYWWPLMVKEFQYGDSLLIDKARLYYAVIDASKQIVKLVSVTVQDSGVYIIKVAKDDGSGGNTTLTTPEMTALFNYIKKRRPPGAKFNVYSLPADKVKYTITALFDPLYDKTAVQASMTAILTDYKNAFGSPASYDGLFYQDDLFAKLKNVAGVKALNMQIDMSLDNNTQIITNLSQEYIELPAGYFEYDHASVLTLTPAP